MWSKDDLFDMAIFVLGIVIGCWVGFVLTFNSMKEKYPKVDLPEEYKEITQDDILRGHFKNDTLYIEFDNTRKTGYELYIQDDTLRVTDPNNGNVIYREKMNWNAPTLMQECIIKDNF